MYSSLKGSLRTASSVLTRSKPETFPREPLQLSRMAPTCPNGVCSVATTPAKLGTRCDSMETKGPPVEWPSP